MQQVTAAFRGAVNGQDCILLTQLFLTYAVSLIRAMATSVLEIIWIRKTSSRFA
jgi:hypothetical protein